MAKMPLDQKPILMYNTFSRNQFKQLCIRFKSTIKGKYHRPYYGVRKISIKATGKYKQIGPEMDLYSLSTMSKTQPGLVYIGCNK
jgi:hypothetical protein